MSDGLGREAGAVLPRLSLMMFLQYAVWGAWLPIASTYLQASPSAGGLGFTPGQIGWILGLAGSIGAICAPFIAGQLADRHFRSERFLACMLILGGGIKWFTARQTSYDAWLWLSIAYSIVYMPTLALSNSIAFAHATNRARDFPRVRVWGTLGWIAASWAFPMIWLQHDLKLQAMPPFLVGPEHADVTHRLVDSLVFSAALSFAYAAVCLFVLPATPPRRDAVEPLAFKRAFGLFRRRSFAALVLSGLIISAVHQIYFIQAGPFLASRGVADSAIMPAMTIGQFSEIAVIALLGLLLKRLGFRTVIVLGTLAYAGRYAIWSLTDLAVPLLIGSMALHGICYACFFAGSYIYVDRLAPADARHSAQTVFGIIMLGGGPVLGGLLNERLSERYTIGGVLDYSAEWATLAGIALIATLAFGLLFRDETRPLGDEDVVGDASEDVAAEAGEVT